MRTDLVSGCQAISATFGANYFINFEHFTFLSRIKNHRFIYEHQQMRVIRKPVLAFDLHNTVNFSLIEIEWPDGHTFGGGVIYFRFFNLCTNIYFVRNCTFCLYWLVGFMAVFRKLGVEVLGHFVANHRNLLLVLLHLSFVLCHLLSKFLIVFSIESMLKVFCIS